MSDREARLSGVAMGCAAGGLAWSLRRRGVDAWALVAAAGGAAAGVAILAPRAWKPVARLVRAVARLVGRVLTPVVLVLLYALVVVPVALAVRLAGADPLRLRRRAGVASHWIERVRTSPSPEDFRRLS